MIPAPIRPTPSVETEASVWADVLVRRGFLHAAVLAPTGHWLIQEQPDGPVRCLTDPKGVVELAAAIQHRIRSKRSQRR
ncbi:hypothetical protein SMICM17S_06225 [Streptomyces microflavus]